MNNKEKVEKSKAFFSKMKVDKNLRSEFIAKPTSTLEKEGILTIEETKIKGVTEYYNSLAKKFEETQENKAVSGEMLGSFWDDAECWTCKIASGALVATAIAGATVATGGMDIPVIAAALGISEGVATIAVGAAGESIAELTSLLLTQICGSC